MDTSELDAMCRDARTAVRILRAMADAMRRSEAFTRFAQVLMPLTGLSPDFLEALASRLEQPVQKM